MAVLAALAVCLANIVASHYRGQLFLWPANIVGKLQPQTLFFSAMYSFFRGEAESGLRFEF